MCLEVRIRATRFRIGTGGARPEKSTAGPDAHLAYGSPVANRPLRVLELFQPPDGGVPEHVRRLTGGLAARGHEVVVGGPADAQLRPDLERVASYMPLDIVGQVPAPREDVSTLRRLGAALEAGRFDAVHVHGQKAGLLGRVAARRAGVPSLYTPHSFVYRTQLRRPRRGARARRAVNLAVERRLGRHTAALVACAEDERDAAVADRVIPPERVHVVLYGVDPDRDAVPDPGLMEFRGEGPLLGFVAGLRDQKGLPTLLDALELLALRDESPRFAIVGNGPLRPMVAERLRAAGLDEATRLVDYGGRVEPYLRALDAFVLPSYWEGMPIAVLEAMAMGLPVVASAVDGTPEAVRDGENGYLVPSHDADALADRLAAVAADPEARERMGSAAQADARRRFGVERMVDEVEALYRLVAVSG